MVQTTTHTVHAAFPQVSASNLRKDETEVAVIVADFCGNCRGTDVNEQYRCRDPVKQLQKFAENCTLSVACTAESF